MKNSDKSKVSEGDKLPSKHPPPKKQVLPKKAEKYLRDTGKIEDYPEGQTGNGKNIKQG
jgi:hypothetical protein